MPRFHRIIRSDLAGVLRYLLRWLPISALVGVLAGCASALLLWSLEVATEVRETHKWLIAFLPVAGLGVGVLYRRYGDSVAGGNNLIFEEIHEPKRAIPFRMTPLILLGTILTHLFGGSAGREGTAVQTGAALADQLARPFRISLQGRRILLMTGISAGFASVFGTPLAGAVFGMEVLVLGAVSYEAIAPCFVGALIGNFITRLLIHEQSLPLITAVPPLSLRFMLFASICGIASGLVARCFAAVTHAISSFFEDRIAWPPMRPFAGGVLVAGAVWLSGTTKYIGLGTPTIAAAFQGRQPPFDFVWKFLFTVMTLGSGFKGGEVTPLFFIGATLGNAMSYVLPLPPALLACMGLAAVFAGAANTPLASTLMAVELFGAEAGEYAAIACVMSYLCSGQAGIYHAQRVIGLKTEARNLDAISA